MAMMSWVGKGMEVVDGMHAGQNKGVIECREIPKHIPSARWYIDDTQLPRRSDAQLWVESSQNWSVLVERT